MANLPRGTVAFLFTRAKDRLVEAAAPPPIRTCVRGDGTYWRSAGSPGRAGFLVPRGTAAAPIAPSAWRARWDSAEGAIMRQT